MLQVITPGSITLRMNLARQNFAKHGGDFAVLSSDYEKLLKEIIAAQKAAVGKAQMIFDRINGD